ncbi:hypothetical protein SeMB42_g07975, partial [Synchytrium endobioticum]
SSIHSDYWHIYHDARAGMRLLGLLSVAYRFDSLFGYKPSSPDKASTSTNGNCNSNPHSNSGDHLSYGTTRHRPQRTSEETNVLTDCMTNAGHSPSINTSLSATMSSPSIFHHAVHSTSADSLSSNGSYSHNNYSNAAQPMLTREEKMIKALEAWQTILLAVYYPLDHIQWFARHQAVTLQSDTARRLSRSVWCSDKPHC